MKQIAFTVVIFVALGVVSGCGERTTLTPQVPAPTNGIYWIEREGSFLPLTVAPAPKDARVWSQVNDNSRYNIDVSFDGFGRRFLPEPPDVRLLVDGKYLRASSYFVSTSLCNYGFADVSETEAVLIASAFGVPLEKRSDPGFKLEWTLTPAKENYTIGENVELLFTVTNVGTQWLAYTKGRSRKGECVGSLVSGIGLNGKEYMDREHKRQMKRYGFLIPVGTSTIESEMVLHPGDSDTVRLNMGELDERGTFQIFTRGHLQLYSPATDRDTVMRNCWDVTIDATNEVQTRKSR